MNGDIRATRTISLRLRIGLLLVASALTPSCGTRSASDTTDEATLANDGVAGASDSEGAAGSTQEAAPDWCEVRAVLADKCQRCHSEPPAHGAPFPLVTFEDTQEVDASGKPRSERMAAAIDSDYMPARFVALKPAVEPLSDAERELLLAWCRGGTPNSGADCDAP